MEILFVVLFVFSSQLVHSVAVFQQNFYNPYPFGTTIFCIAHHPLLLISSIFYLGWFWGFALFLLHFFGIIHATFSWIFDIPILFFKNEQQVLHFEKLKINLLFPSLILYLIFTVASFFLSDFKVLFDFIKSDTSIFYSIVLIAAILSAVRKIVLFLFGAR